MDSHIIYQKHHKQYIDLFKITNLFFEQQILNEDSEEAEK